MRILQGSPKLAQFRDATPRRTATRITFPWAFRRAVPALALLLMAGVTALPASAQYAPGYGYAGPVYYAPGMSPYGPGYYGNGPYQNLNRYGSANGDTDFGYATIPPTVNPDADTSQSNDSTDGRMYMYNFTGTAGPVYENPGTPDWYCFPC